MQHNSQEQQVLISIRQIIRATDIYSRKLSKEVGLTAPQLLILQAIKELGAVSISKLSENVSLSQATVTNIIDRLESRSLVDRHRSTQDKRVVHATLTDAGLYKVSEAPTPIQNTFSKRYAELADWERAMIVAALQRVAAMMNAEEIDASPVLHVGTAIDQAATN
ncbi:MAG: MarR family transcriptional regulator [Pseudomonadales bacterium]|nr:MarR family transcriptional regulator [Pseudomonadales bacterium]